MNETDEAVLGAVRRAGGRTTRLRDLCAVVLRSDREVDRALQRLRRAGLISYSPVTGWSAVDRRPEAGSLFWCTACHRCIEAPGVLQVDGGAIHEVCRQRATVYGWAEFSRGRWIRTMPAVPGTYFVAAVDEVGPVLPGRTVVVYRVDGTRKLRTTVDWGGWWWSVPLPLLPGVE